MSGPKRGFSKEKHGALKAGLTVVAVAGFGTAWLGFSAAQPDVVSENDLAIASPQGTTTPGTATPAATRTATTSRTPLAGTPTAMATTETSDPPEPLPTFPRPKGSRGS